MADEQTESCPAQSFRRPFITDTIKNLNTKLLFILFEEAGAHIN